MKAFAPLFILAAWFFTSCSPQDADQAVQPVSTGWQWARAMGGPTNEDEIDAVAADQFGNVYVSGKFERTLTMQGSAVPFTSAGQADIMVVKYNREGRLLWAKQFGNAGEDNVFDAACDAQGNLVLSGYFQGSVSFGSAGSLTSRGGLDMMLLKMTPEGAVLWARQLGGSGDDGGNEVSISPNGQIIVGAQSTGTFENFANTGVQDAYVLSVAPTGTTDWIRSVQGPGTVRAKAITVDAQGNVYLGGDFFGPNKVVAPSGDVPLMAWGRWDAYLTSWTAAGALRWSKSWGGSGDDLCKGVAVNEDMEVFTVGQFQQTVQFDGQRLTAASPQNLFLWKLAQTGVPLWLNHISSLEILYGAELELDGEGGVLFGQGLTGTTTFQETTGARTVAAPGVGSWPTFIRYHRNGTCSSPTFADKSVNASFQELTRSGDLVYLDCEFKDGLHQFGPDQLLGPTSNKDAAIVAMKMR